MRVWARGSYGGSGGPLRVIFLALAVGVTSSAQAAGGDTCGAATVIAALPYTDAAVTSCGFGDDTNNTGAATCSDLASTYPGPDAFYRLELGAGNNVAISVDLPSGSTGDLAVFLLQISTCGGAASCAGHSVDVVGAGQGPERIKAKAYPAGTYYVVVDSVSAAPASSACGVYSLNVTGSLGAVGGTGGAGGTAGAGATGGAGGTSTGGAGGTLGTAGATATGGAASGGVTGAAGSSSGGTTGSGGLGGSTSPGGTAGAAGAGAAAGRGGGGRAAGGSTGSGGAVSSGGAGPGSGGIAAGGANGAGGGSSSAGGASSLGGTSGGSAGAGGRTRTGGTSGAAGISGVGGSKGTAGATGHPDGGTSDGRIDSDASSGCSCETAPGRSSTPATLISALALALGLSLSTRRRRRR